ncbi:glycosyltransferase [Pedobacter endophyticus]|uniref:Uncharacterized protein n=1 Tax=Pedobacter endophyticus TaxID=2789740 RepID=A0A7U3Q5B5_9SPHI|nr:hypothetical protein [Pedobacter endophyticus]QPH37955.1 hypothetical protein IZT61_12660 [Pedobacter endophyticus]
MSQVLFLSSPVDNDVNPILSLASEMITRGEKVTFFGSDELKQPIENIGADFKSYSKDSDVFNKKESEKSGLITALLEPMKFIDDIAVQLRGLNFDYAVFSDAYPYANVITRLLGIPKTQYSGL